MRLIDANKVYEVLTDYYHHNTDVQHIALADALSKVPSVEAEPVRHGHWQITEAYPHNVYCSECYTKFAQTHWTVWEDGSLPRHYCPRCGARMDGEQDG